MANYEVELVANEGIFQGLAKQNMLFHQCIGELLDNAIGSCPKKEKFHIEIFFDKHEGDVLDVYIADNSSGMSLDLLKSALQLGRTPCDSQDRLHEHGFGLKNSLATLTKETKEWIIWTKERDSNDIYQVNLVLLSK